MSRKNPKPKSYQNFTINPENDRKAKRSSMPIDQEKMALKKKLDDIEYQKELKRINNEEY